VLGGTSVRQISCVVILRNLSDSDIRTFGDIGANKLNELGEISGFRR